MYRCPFDRRHSDPAHVNFHVASAAPEISILFRFFFWSFAHCVTLRARDVMIYQLAIEIPLLFIADSITSRAAIRANHVQSL